MNWEIATNMMYIYGVILVAVFIGSSMYFCFNVKEGESIQNAVEEIHINMKFCLSLSALWPLFCLFLLLLFIRFCITHRAEQKKEKQSE